MKFVVNRMLMLFYSSTVYNKNAVAKHQECCKFNSLKYINANENTKLYKL